MLSLTVWQLLAVLVAGGFLALAALMWVAGRLADEGEDSMSGCLGRALALALAASSAGLLALVIRAAW